ncbi:hypothetical protein BKA62DRAFT_764283 [Auriculariales sp. MPI-PUGE-AT-0066]|nr:hypothetical protein BKA62DRAFT_764283 [Auriculariales sp. MPI-PUGE-AT-0066]
MLPTSPVNFDDEFMPAVQHETGFIPSRAATPEPYSPGSRPMQLRETTPPPSSARFDPYSIYHSSSTRRRPRAKDNKRSMNAFLFYRRAFPSMYPVIDMLEKQQGAKSAIIGALWRREPQETKEQFYLMQERASEEFRVNHGVSDTPRSDPIKTLIRRDRARQRRAADDKLSPRSELIVSLWEDNKTDDDIINAIGDFDLRSGPKPKPEPKQSKPKSKASVPLANQTNKAIITAEDAAPTTPVLQITTSIPESAPTPALSESCSSPSLSSPPTPFQIVPGHSFYDVQSGVPSLDAPFILPASEFSKTELVPAFDMTAYTSFSSGWQQMSAPTPFPPFQQQQQQMLAVPMDLPWPSHVDPQLTISTDQLGASFEASVYAPSHAVYSQVPFGAQYGAPVYGDAFALGSQDDLAGLAAYDGVAPSFDGLLDSYIDYSCMPQF